MATYQAIGFSHKYYTLWNIDETIQNYDGHKYKVVNCHFVKNISFNKDKALAAYPNARFDEELAGKNRYWSYRKEVWENINQFRYGKYKYQDIEKSNDFDYLKWYWTTCPEVQKSIVEMRLRINGYEIRIDKNGNKYIVSPFEIANQRKEYEEMKQILDKLDKKIDVSFIPDHNLDRDGYYRDGKILYKFEEISENWYKGFPYYLPILNNKAKRIKNKTINVLNYNYEINENDDIVVYIKYFEIVK